MKVSLLGRRRGRDDLRDIYSSSSNDSPITTKSSSSKTGVFSPLLSLPLDILMKTYGEQAGIPESKRHFHVLKHSISTHLLDAGADIKFVQDWLGHANIQNTEIYAKLSGATREKKARELFLKMPKF